MPRFFKRLIQPSSFAGVSNLSLLAILLPSILGRGERVGAGVAETVETGIQAGSAAVASGVDPVSAAVLGAVAAGSSIASILRDDKSDN